MAKLVPLYLMISRTQSGIGRMIRAATRYSYNHVSLTLDPTLRRWVSFARYSRNMPLYGGFIEESAERYLAEGEDVPVRIFRLEIPEDRAVQLKALFSQAGNRDFRLIYNTYDAVLSALGWRLAIPNAYTCLSFTCTVLGIHCVSIRELDRYLTPKLIYDGSLAELVADSGRRDDAYFSQLSFIQGTWCTARHFAVLSGRAILRGGPDLVAPYLK